MPRLAVHGALKGIPAYILIDSDVYKSQVSQRFSLAHNLPRTVRVVSGIAYASSRGPVEVPTVRGFYTSTFEMTVTSISEAFDVILGQDWIAHCSPELSRDSVADPTQNVVDTLPEGHRWDPLRGPRNNPFSGASRDAVPTTRHERFYFEDGNVVLQVEQTLYKVHRHFLKSHSDVFETMFTLPPESHPEGLRDDDPIYLPHTKCADFDRLFSLFYPRDVVKGDLHSIDEWKSVLEISSRWGFEAHRTLALERIDRRVSSVDRLLLAKQYNISKWLTPAYVSLCMRDTSLTLDEGKLLAIDDVIGIAAIRERRLRRKLSREYLQEIIEQKVKNDIPWSDIS